MNALELFRTGLDTAQIAERTNQTEDAVYNQIGRLRRAHRWKAAKRHRAAVARMAKKRATSHAHWERQKAELDELRAEANR